MSAFSPEENDTVADDASLDSVEVFEVDTFERVESPHAQTDSFWDWLRGLFSGPLDQRLDDLTDAINLYPEAPSNYVQRGEIYMQMGEYELAVLDFEIALELAAEQFDEDKWGFLSQTQRDQAEYGLQRAQRKLVRKRKP